VLGGGGAQHAAGLIQQHGARSTGSDIDSQEFAGHVLRFLAERVEKAIREIVFLATQEPKREVVATAQVLGIAYN
jgi:hypothetical protein